MWRAEVLCGSDGRPAIASLQGRYGVAVSKVFEACDRRRLARWFDLFCYG